MMVPRRLLMALVLVAVPQAGHGQITRTWDSRAPIVLFVFDRGFDRFVQGYYRRPDPSRAIAWFRRLDLARARTASPATVHMPAMLSSFYARVIERSAGAATALAKAAVDSRSSNHLSIAYAAIWQARPRDWRAAIGSLERVMSASGRAYMRRAYRSRRRQPVLSWTIDRPWKLDIFWACYFATGDRRYLRKIADTLDNWLPRHRFFAWVREVGRANRAKRPAQRRPDRLTLRRLIAAPAYIFLRNNARRHPAIVPVLRKVARTSGGAKRAAALTILREIGQR